MTVHHVLDDALRDRATAYVLGVLDPEDHRRCEVHFAECEVCCREMKELREIKQALGVHARASIGAEALWTRVAERVSRDAPDRVPSASHVDSSSSGTAPQVWQHWVQPEVTARGEGTFVASHVGPFEPTGLAGVEARRLFVDAENDRATFLVRMAPSGSYPAHEHAGPEECFVLQGDLRVGALHMHAGDYQRVEAGSRHATQTTDGGCLLLITSSLHDRILA